MLAHLKNVGGNGFQGKRQSVVKDLQVPEKVYEKHDRRPWKLGAKNHPTSSKPLLGIFCAFQCPENG